MRTIEKRKKPRIDSHNLLSYICFDENDQEVKQGMGRTLNVSEGGILMDTHVPFDKKAILSLTIGMEDDLMDIKGKIAFCRKRKAGHFETGIQFLDLDEEKLRSLKQYIIIFREEKALVDKEFNQSA
ncbi:MAG: PilZ domain-containing protein [Thermodesulfobacteriota bacterium]|nr:PilZ domain-containing protein [Thermodesulfobacteriota bacterium]